MMVKKAFGVILALILIMNIIPSVNAYTDVSADSAVYDAVNFLSDMGIFSGYNDGTFKPDKTLTRAEFAKLIVMIADKEKEAQFNSVISKFPDVHQGAWYVGYVNYIADSGVINGYADGNFGPEKPITFAEAVTILCRFMGYTEETVGYFWPKNYINQASQLGVTDGFAFEAGTPVTRGVAAVLIERILFSDMPAETAPTGQQLIEFLGYTLYENSFVMATRAESASLGSRQVKTASGVYKLADGVVLPNAGDGGTVVINKDGELAGIRKDAFESLTVYVTSMPDANTIEYRTTEGSTGKYTFDSGFTVYSNYIKQTYAQSMAQISTDTEITFCGDEYGEWDFAVIDNDIAGNTAVLAMRNYSESDTEIGGVTINKTNLQIYRNGESAKLSDIKKNDVIYYNNKTNVIDVYSKKVSGVYANAYPDKAHVTSVKVAGKTYTLSDTGAAKRNLDASVGSFAIGERVTLLLGKNDKVEFAVEINDFNYSDYGVLLECRTEISTDGYDEGTSRMVADIFMPDGETNTYAVSKDYSNTLKGKLVHLSYNGGVVSLSGVGESAKSGSLDIANRKFAGDTVLKDVKVLHRLSAEDAENVSIEVLDFDTLGVNQLTGKQVISVVSANSFDDIGILYLENMASSYRYGYLARADILGMGDDVSYKYSIYTDGITAEYPNSARYSVNAKQPVMYKTEGNSVSEIYNLKEIASAGSIEAYESGRIRLKGSVYYVDDDVEVIYIENSTLGKYRTLSVADIGEMNIKSIKLFAQKDEGKNSAIRVIVVN